MDIVITNSNGKTILKNVSFVGSSQNHYGVWDYERQKIYEKRKRIIKKLLEENE